MLWLCLHLPCLPLEALHCGPNDAPLVVTSSEGNARWVVGCNDSAHRKGLKVGMNCSLALAMQPQLQMLERKQQAECHALERLAAWAYQFSSTVIVIPAADLARPDGGLVWLEIGSSLRLFGGFRRFIERLEIELGQLGYTYQLGIGPTLEGAALLARCAIRVAITTTQALYHRIRSLSVTQLPLEDEIAGQLQTVGIRSIGALLELPRDAVARRFGPQMSNYLDRLTGSAADPRPAYQPSKYYDAHFDFEFEIHSSESLLFPLRRLLREFAGFLCGHDTAVQCFTLSLQHRQASTELRIGLLAPERNAERLFGIARERLEATALTAATRGIRLLADEFSLPTALQPDLLNGSLQQHEDFAHTIDRLTARLGAASVHGLKLKGEHRPEMSGVNAKVNETAPDYEFANRPLWLLPEPKALQLSGLPASGPERIESGWWDGGDVRRDYYVVRTTQGADLWVFRDLADSNWYLHGFWS